VSADDRTRAERVAYWRERNMSDFLARFGQVTGETKAALEGISAAIAERMADVETLLAAADEAVAR